MHDEISITGAIEAAGSKIALRGNLNLKNARELAVSLQRAVASSNQVEIDISGLTHIDASSLQLLLSIRKSTQRQGKVLLLTGMLDECCRQILISLGLLGPGGEPRTSAEAFWLSQTASKAQVA